MKYSVNFEIELKKNKYKGLYIALEGIDGSGKTTQAKALKKYFEGLGKKVFMTYEPRRDGSLGPLIHNILQGEIKVPPVANQYIFAAQRVVHVEEMIIPALKRGEVVISDRCFWSSIPYGLFDREISEGKPADNLLASLSLLSFYHQFIAPDFTFYLEVNVDTAGSRLSSKGGKDEIYEKSDKLIKIREGYDFIFKKFPNVLIKIDANKEINEVTKEILQILNNKFKI